MCRHVPSVPTLVRLFIRNGCWLLSNAFISIYWDDHVIFLSFADGMYHIDCFAYVEPSLWTWDESYLVMMYDLFLCVAANILLRILHLYSSKVLARNFIFLLDLCLVLELGWWWLHSRKEKSKTGEIPVGAVLSNCLNFLSIYSYILLN